MKSSDLIDRLLLCDGEGLSCAMAARSGSGKTVLLTHLIESASRLDRFKNQRFIYASMKQETNFDAPIVSDMTSLVKALKKNRIVTYYPTDPESYEEDIDELIETIFSLADENPESGFHLTLDDANVMRGFTLSQKVGHRWKVERCKVALGDSSPCYAPSAHQCQSIWDAPPVDELG